MQSQTLVFLAALVAMTYAAGQYYVPRAYYTIDSEGNESPTVPLRRLRRSLMASRGGGWGNGGASAEAHADANSYGGGGANAVAEAHANANSYGRGWGSGQGGWGVPNGLGYGASNPNAGLSAGQYRSQSGPILGARSVSAGSSVGVDSSGTGYYDQYTSVQP